MNRLITGFLLLFLCFTPVIHALEVEQVYQATVEVADRSDNTRSLAARDALNEVLIRASGVSTAADSDLVQRGLRRATAYLQRFTYRELGEERRLAIEFAFDPVAVRGLLKDAGLPNWGSNRPLMMTWMAIGDQSNRFLLGTESEDVLRDLMSDPFSSPDEKAQIEVPDIQGIIESHLKARGLPHLFPLMDLEDSFNISVTDVWGRFVQPIRMASERYPADAILTVQLMTTGSSWVSRWLLMHQGKTESYELETADIESALIQGYDWATDNVAAVYAVVESELASAELLVSVTNVQTLDDYAALVKYLSSITAVKAVKVMTVDGSRVMLALELVSNEQAMLQAITLNSLLVAETRPQLEANYPADRIPSLFFRWQGARSLP